MAIDEGTDYHCPSWIFLLCNLLIPPQRGQAKPLCKVGGFTIAIAD